MDLGKTDKLCVVLLLSMDINRVPVKELPQVYEQLKWELADIEVRIAHCRKFKNNVYAQRDLIDLKDKKKRLTELKKLTLITMDCMTEPGT